MNSHNERGQSPNRLGGRAEPHSSEISTLLSPEQSSADESSAEETSRPVLTDWSDDTIGIQAIMSHVVDPLTCTVSFKVLATNGRVMNTDERTAQKLNEPAVLAYWNHLGDRTKATQLTKWHVFKILSDTGNQTMTWRDHCREVGLLCQWVGFSKNMPDVTWEPKGKILRIAPDVYEEYWKPKHYRSSPRNDGDRE